VIFEKLEHAIHRVIILHEQLRELIEKEKDLFTENRLDDIVQETVKRKQIEMEIKRTNTIIQTYFKHIEHDNSGITGTQERTLSLLIDKLRENFIYTADIVEQALNALHEMKHETLNELKTFGKTQKALKIYSQNC